MIDSLISFLEKFTNFLKSLKSDTPDNPNNKTRKNIIFFLVLGVLLFAGLGFILIVILDQNYEHGEYFWSYITAYLLVSIFLLFTLAKASGKNAKEYFYVVHLPLFLAGSTLLLSTIIDPPRGFNILFHLAITFFPLCYILQFYFQKLKENKYITKLTHIFALYNLGFFFILSLNVFLISLGVHVMGFEPWTSGLWDFLGNDYINGFIEGVFYLICSFIFLLYSVYTLHIYFNYIGAKRKNLHIGIILLLGVYLVSLSGSAISVYYSHQINKSYSILSKEGENFKGYKDAKVFSLDSAFLSKIKDGRLINLNHFQKLYDTTPEAYFGEKVAKYTSDRRSFATDSSKIGDSAEVLMTLGEIENTVKSSSGVSMNILETTYSFHFSNTSDINQEVVLSFETPNKDSVVTGLKLGLDLEMIGQISPRGAAKAVYEDSLRKNIDPALIEKVGLNTYTLRVFPIPSKLDTVSKGKQLVEVKVLSPIGADTSNLNYSPKFSLINIKFDEASSLISKVYDKSELITEDIIKGNKIETYISENHNLEKKLSNTKTEESIENYCLTSDEDINLYLSLKSIDLKKKKTLTNKTSIFFDNSTSVDRSKANNLYEEIFTQIKNFEGKLNDVDLYSYNFDVEKIAEVKDIKYWGYSNIDRVIDYIIANNIQNENIIFITDDDSFNINEIENKNRNFETLLSNKISVIKIGERVKTYKSDFTNILSASYGNIYEIINPSEIAKVLNQVMSNDEKALSENCIQITSDNENLQKIYAGFISNKILGNIKNSGSWNEVATAQTFIAKKYGIVNQFNSLIALQTKQQQEDLKKYEQQANKYDSSYNIFGDKQEEVMDGWEAESIAETNIGLQEANPTLPMEGATRSSKGGYTGDSFNNSLEISGYNNGMALQDYDIGYRGTTKVSIFALFIWIVYIIQFIAFLNFIVKYVRNGEESMTKQSKIIFIILCVIGISILYVILHNSMNNGYFY